MECTYINHNLGKIPPIDLTVRRVEASVWNTLGFDLHHYLTTELNPSAKCLLFEWNGEPVAFVGLLNSPRKGHPHDVSVSRIVILPDFQGLGLARKIMDFVGGLTLSQGEDYNLYIKTAHDKMGAMLERNSNWRPTSLNGKERTLSDEKKYSNRLTRRSYCYAYIGKVIQGYDNLLLPVQTIREQRSNRYQLNLFDNFGM